MARGRNHNRNRNHQTIQSSQQQHQKHLDTSQPSQQQQISQKHLIYQQQQQHPQLSSCQKQPMQSTNAADAPVAAINKHNESGSGNELSTDTNLTPSASNSESYGHNNNYNNTKINNNNYDRRRPDDATAPMNKNSSAPSPLVGGIAAIKTHLETNGDPTNHPATIYTTTHTYQMTMSNNSLTDFSQDTTANNNNSEDEDEDEEDDNEDHTLPLQRELCEEQSNSAREQRVANLATNNSPHQYRQESENTQRSSLQPREETDVDQLSNGPTNNEQCYINRSPVIERNVSVNAQVTPNNVELKNQQRATSVDGVDNDQLNDYDEVTTVCDRNRVLITETEISFSTTSMGQKNTKGGEVPSSTTTTNANTRREFRESSLPATPTNDYRSNAGSTNAGRLQSPSKSLPTITVSDCSGSVPVNGPSHHFSAATNINLKRCGDSEREEFYDFEQQQSQEFNAHNLQHNDKEPEYCSHVPQVEGASSPKANSPSSPSSPSSYRSPSPTSMYSQMRYNYVKLEDVPEQEEEDYEEDQDDNDDDDDDGEEVEVDNDADDSPDEGNETDEGPLTPTQSQTTATHVNRPANTNFASPQRHRVEVNLDSEFLQRHNSTSLSPDRQQYAKSIDISHSNSQNSTESNLSTSYPDSGMGESVASTNSRFINNPSANDARSNLHQHQHQYHPQHHHHNGAAAEQHHQQQHLPFVRDGSSTDCDETLMQCEELIDFVETPEFLDPSERLVCIESISLPDVVVESTNSCGGNSSSGCGSNTAAMGSASSDSASGGERDIININGATGNAMGNVHFIPIHVEGSGSGNNSGRSSPRRQCVDDSVVGSGKTTIEIIEDVTVVNTAPKSSIHNDLIADKLKKELLEQKTQFSAQLEDAHKNVNHLHTKINEMQMKIETLEQELSTKTWNVERLQGELSAAQRDDEYVRQKLKVLEDEKTKLRHRYSDCEDELKMKYDELEVQYNELQEKYKQTQTLASNLQIQLAQAQSEAQEWREEVDRIRTSLEEQIALLKSALENSENERKICEDKWQREFEMLRTQNMDREESIMTDCEWQLRETQKQCKERYDKVEAARIEAVENVDLLEAELETLCKEIDDLKIYQSQVNSLRGVVNEQANSIESLMSQIESLKQELATANENLEEQIEAVTKIKFHCDNALYDKERQTIYRIDEVRNEAAAFWEDKLYTEMTRLKNELESVYVDERREALDKLQMEHVEELKALTNRYTDNEEELRTELNEVQQNLELKSQEFLELRERSDNALLQTRMHLDRADREFQKAMCQEEERREALEQSLRSEFETEKLEMEEKFRERLGQVKEEFAKELQINTQELTQEHQKELDKIRAKLTAEKDQALQELSERHRKKMFEAEEKIKEIELRYKRDLKDLKAAYDAEKVALDKRDISNANEIEQLHRKCRCLTNLFEEMRMRYERRDPRPEDLREIAELRERCESQERDMYLLTDRLREMQIQMNELQENKVNNNSTTNNSSSKKSKQIKKPPPKTIPTNCDVIYEENEERESPPPTPNSYTTDSINDADEDDDVDGDINRTDDSKKQKIVGISTKSKSKLIADTQQDDSHMITAM